MLPTGTSFGPLFQVASPASSSSSCFQEQGPQQTSNRTGIDYWHSRKPQLYWTDK